MSPGAARFGSMGGLAALIVAGGGVVSPSVCGWWLPDWLPEASLALPRFERSNAATTLSTGRPHPRQACRRAHQTTDVLGDAASPVEVAGHCGRVQPQDRTRVKTLTGLKLVCCARWKLFVIERQHTMAACAGTIPVPVPAGLSHHDLPPGNLDTSGSSRIAGVAERMLMHSLAYFISRLDGYDDRRLVRGFCYETNPADYECLSIQ